LLLLQPLLEEHAPAEVAAALLSMLRSDTATVQPPGGSGRSARPTAPDMPSWSRLFISIGTRDGVGPGDLVGAISGESGIKGSQVGKIEIRESISLVEVEKEVAETVIKALNGTTVRGRSVRVDFDRGNRGGGGRGPGAGRGGAARGPGGGGRAGGRPGGRGGPPRRD
jgi:ATP-dependent RNA helicase DeaD